MLYPLQSTKKGRVEAVRIRSHTLSLSGETRMEALFLQRFFALSRRGRRGTPKPAELPWRFLLDGLTSRLGEFEAGFSCRRMDSIFVSSHRFFSYGTIMTQPAEGGEELLSRVRHGDKEALAELFSRHRDRLTRVIRFRLDPRLQRRVDAEDIVQEAYLNAEQRLQHFEGNSMQSFFIWLRMIAGQTLIDIHRRHIGAQQRDAGREQSIEGFLHPHATSTSMAFLLAASRTSASQAAIRAEMSTQIERAIEGMDPIDREILALRHFEELTNGEVAEVLEIEQKAASIRYVRALGRLKRILLTLSDFAVGDPNRSGSPAGDAGNKR